MIVGIVLILFGSLGAPAAAHGELEAARSDPSPGAVRGVPPERVDLWFTEPLDPNGSTIEVFDAQRQRVDSRDAQVDPIAPQHMRVSLESLVDGTYTVAWRTTSTADGHTIQGTFTFRVGQSRLPGGAATTDGEQPSPAAVGARWLTLIGLSLVAGWFLIGLIGVNLGAARPTLALSGALLALLADLALVPAQAYWPASGLPRQPLREIITIMPDAWYIRLALEALLLVAVAIIGSRRLPPRWSSAVGGALAALAVLTLTFTSHAAAETSGRLLAMTTNALHLESVSFWLGGLAYFAAAPTARQALEGQAVRRFSRLALILAPIAVITGILNAGLLLPTLASAWQSDYGRLLLLKLAIVLGVLGFAWRNRSALRAGLQRIERFVRSLRIETGLGAAALLAAATLALWAPPAPPDTRPLHLRTAVDGGLFAHLVLDRPEAAKDDLTIWLSDTDHQPLGEVGFAEASVSMLERPITLNDVHLERQPDGRWSAQNVPVTVKGWWQADLRFAGSGIPETRASFIFLVPDPTFVGGERGRPTDPEAAEWFNDALDNMLQLRSLRTTETLADGIGNSVTTDYSFLAPNALTYATSSGNDSIAIGSDQYYRSDGGEWTHRERVVPFSFPDIIETYYSEASGFTLGNEVTVDDRRYQIVSFYVPEITGRDESWYIWWVDAESRLIWREGMVGEYHYMKNDYRDYNAPLEITAPPIGSDEKTSSQGTNVPT